MADYKSIYSGEEIDTAVGRALTLTQLDGTVIIKMQVILLWLQ